VSDALPLRHTTEIQILVELITQTKNIANKINPDDSRYKKRPFVAVISKFYPNTLEFCSNKLFNSNNAVSLCFCISPLIFTSS